MHSAVISSRASPGGHLSLTLDFSNPTRSAPMLASQLQFPSPGLRSIALKSSDGPVTQSGLLAACIASHTSLTHLSLNGFCVTTIRSGACVHTSAHCKTCSTWPFSAARLRACALLPSLKQFKHCPASHVWPWESFTFPLRTGNCPVRAHRRVKTSCKHCQSPQSYRSST